MGTHLSQTVCGQTIRVVLVQRSDISLVLAQIGLAGVATFSLVLITKSPRGDFNISLVSINRL